MRDRGRYVPEHWLWVQLQLGLLQRPLQRRRVPVSLAPASKEPRVYYRARHALIIPNLCQTYAASALHARMVVVPARYFEGRVGFIWRTKSI